MDTPRSVELVPEATFQVGPDVVVAAGDQT
jgi:hypothetical protein